MVNEKLRKKLDELREESREMNGPLSSARRWARARLGRAAMPKQEDNDIDCGEGARHKQPVRYDD